MEDKRLNQAIVSKRSWQLLFLLGCVGLFLYFCYSISAVLNPVLIAFLIAYILDPVVTWFERRSIARPCAIALIFIVMATASIILILYTVPAVVSQVQSLSMDMVGDDIVLAKDLDKIDMSDEYYKMMAEPFVDSNDNKQWDDATDDKKAEAFEDYNRNGTYDVEIYYYDGNGNEQFDLGYLDDATFRAQSLLAAINSRLQASGASPVELHDIKDHVREKLKANMGTIAKQGMTVLVDVLAAIGASVNMLMFIVTIFILLPFYTYFIMDGMPKLQAMVVGHLPHQYKEQILKTIGDVHNSMSGFFRGMFIVCSVKSIVYSIGLYLFGVPSAVVFGVLAGLFTMIPIFGVPMIMIPALLIAYFQMGMSGTFVGLVIFYIVVEMLDGFVLQTIVLGNSVKLHPMLILLSVFVGGELAGLFGMLVAVPLAAILKILFLDYLLPHMEDISKPETAK